MVARQTIIRTRSDDTGIAAAVAAVVRPEDFAIARSAVRRSQATRRSATIKTSFCPLCGGDKSRDAKRCLTCRNRAQHDYSAKAAAAGHPGSLGRRGSARSLIVEAQTRVNPSHGETTEAPTWSRRVKGAGVTKQQPPWSLKVLVNGIWVSEDSLPDGIERRAVDDEAVQRLSSAKGRNPLRVVRP
jgi:hypothetical protein